MILVFVAENNYRRKIRMKGMSLEL